STSNSLNNYMDVTRLHIVHGMDKKARRGCWRHGVLAAGINASMERCPPVQYPANTQACIQILGKILRNLAVCTLLCRNRTLAGRAVGRVLRAPLDFLVVAFHGLPEFAALQCGLITLPLLKRVYLQLRHGGWLAAVVHGNHREETAV